MPSLKSLVVGGAVVVGAVVLWRILRAPLAQFAGSLVTTVGGKAVAEAAAREALGDAGYAKVIAMRGQTEIG